MNVYRYSKYHRPLLGFQSLLRSYSDARKSQLEIYIAYMHVYKEDVYKIGNHFSIYKSHQFNETCSYISDERNPPPDEQF